MVKKYRLVLQEITADTQVFAQNLMGMGVQEDLVRELIRRVPVIVKTGLTLPQARWYAESLQKAGARVVIQENGYSERTQKSRPKVSITPLRAFVLCPRCGMKQPKGLACVRCGMQLGKGQQQGSKSVTGN